MKAIETHQKNIELSYKNKRRSFTQDEATSEKLYTQWNTQIIEILSDKYKCRDENIFTQERKSSEKERLLKREQKKKIKNNTRKKIY